MVNLIIDVSTSVLVKLLDEKFKVSPLSYTKLDSFILLFGESIFLVVRTLPESHVTTDGLSFKSTVPVSVPTVVTYAYSYVGRIHN